MIEEAKKLATEIRFQDDEEIPNTPVFRQGADMIDALVAEIERLRDCLEYAYKIFGNRGMSPKLMEVMAWLAMTESAMKENKHD